MRGAAHPPRRESGAGQGKGCSWATHSITRWWWRRRSLSRDSEGEGGEAERRRGVGLRNEATQATQTATRVTQGDGPYDCDAMVVGPYTTAIPLTCNLLEQPL